MKILFEVKIKGLIITHKLSSYVLYVKLKTDLGRMTHLYINIIILFGVNYDAACLNYTQFNTTTSIAISIHRVLFGFLYKRITSDIYI